MRRVFRKAAGFPCAVRSARRPAFRAPSVSQGVRRSPRRPYPQGGGVSVRRPFRKAAGFPCAVRSAKGVRFSLRYRFSKAAGSRRAAAPKRRAFRARSVSQGVRRSPRHRIRKAAVSRRAAAPKRRAFRARSVPQGGGFPARGSPKRRAFRARLFPQGVRRSPRHRIRKAAGFPCAVCSARRRAFRAPSVSQGERRSPRHRIRKAAGFSVCGPFRKAAGSLRAAPQSGGLSVRGPFRKAAGFRRAATMQGGWLWLRPPGERPRRSDLLPLLAGGTHAAFRRAGRAHPLPAAGTKRQAARVLDAGAEGTLGLCQGDPPPFRLPLGLGAARPLVCPEGGKNARGLRLRGVEKGKKGPRPMGDAVLRGKPARLAGGYLPPPRRRCLAGGWPNSGAPSARSFRGRPRV